MACLPGPSGVAQHGAEAPVCDGCPPAAGAQQQRRPRAAQSSSGGGGNHSPGSPGGVAAGHGVGQVPEGVQLGQRQHVEPHRVWGQGPRGHGSRACLKNTLWVVYATERSRPQTRRRFAECHEAQAPRLHGPGCCSAAAHTRDPLLGLLAGGRRVQGGSHAEEDVQLGRPYAAAGQLQQSGGGGVQCVLVR